MGHGDTGSLSAEERQRIEAAVARGIAAYVVERKAKIPAFLQRHFSFRASFALQKRTFTRDFYKIPLNTLWAAPVFTAHTLGFVCHKLGAARLGGWLRKIPVGLKTRFEDEINWLIQSELLELPCTMGERRCAKDALMETILRDPAVAAFCADYLARIEAQSRSAAFRQALEANLAEYGKSKLAVSELAGNVISLAAGLAAFQKATPGVLGVGTATATALAQQMAIANFWLGPTLGGWYYAVFPASASAGLMAASTGALMMATGILVSLSLVVLDPLLAKTGYHRKRLERFVQTLGDQWLGKTQDPYRVRDQYLARVMDLLDLLKLAARTLG